jgi:hypothetical protein
MEYGIHAFYKVLNDKCADLTLPERQAIDHHKRLHFTESILVFSITPQIIL